ncbi:MAG: hypothetical protein EHM42_15115 [Planctomycetaceae bacterium]|nr:MAG: hypothetical protein EHM42_15115 [Planctomycetaceae bacterium]
MFYPNAAAATSGTVTATSSFSLNSGNRNATDLVTDGTTLWVVDDSTTDKVFKYSLAGALQGSWTINSANSSPTGITIDPSNASQDIWIVDSGTDRVYRYANGRTLAAPTLTDSFALAAANTNPQGIADPKSSLKVAPLQNGRLPGVADSLASSQSGRGLLATYAMAAQAFAGVQSAFDNAAGAAPWVIRQSTNALASLPSAREPGLTMDWVCESTKSRWGTERDGLFGPITEVASSSQSRQSLTRRILAVRAAFETGFARLSGALGTDEQLAMGDPVLDG